MNNINLFAFLLPAMIFLYWGIVGYAGLCMLRTQRNIMQNILLAPTVGVAILFLPLFFLNRLGIAVEYLATPITSILLFLSIIILYWRKPIFPLRRYLPFLGIFLASLVLIGLPLLNFGFNWISFSNDDIGFYCLGATRLLHHGFSELPNVNDIVQNREYSLSWWFIHVAYMHRCGSEYLLAWLSSLTTINPVQIFMPLIIGLNLTLISATGAMVYQSARCRRVALITCALLTCSALAALGTLYQLIAQVTGLSLLIAACMAMLHSFSTHQRYFALHQSVLITLIVCTLVVVYPEVLPFLVCACLLYFGIGLIQGWRPSRTFWLTAGLFITFSAILLNTYWVNVGKFTVLAPLTQLGTLSVKQAELVKLFPYFLIPSGISDLWGLHAISASISEPWQSIVILLGLALSLLVIVIATSQLLKQNIPAIMTCIMAALGIILYYRDSGFGLFKLAMYAQPFIISMLVIGILSVKRRKAIGLILIPPLVVLNILALGFYSKCSYGDLGSSFVELPGASRSHLLDELNVLSKKLSSSSVATDTPDIIVAKIMGTYFVGTQNTFYSSIFFGDAKSLYRNNPTLKTFFPAIFKTSEKIEMQIGNQSIPLNFLVYDPQDPQLTNSFQYPLIALKESSNLIMSTSMREVFNRRKFSDLEQHNFIALPIKDVTNYLIFTNSSLGHHYLDFSAELKYISLHNLERDYYFQNHSMVGIGRYLLFQAIHPSKNVRIELTITETLNNDSNNLLPPAAVIGNKRVSFNLMGRGSARIFSRLTVPQIINNIPFIMVDMGRDGKQFPEKRTGFMKFYGNSVSLDHRLLNGFVRDVSLVSDEEYKNIIAPSSISHFPNDLANSNLEYSGMYEDGWISEDSFFNLQQKPNALLIIKGMLPAIFDNSKTTNKLTILVDGKKLSSQTIAAGNFNIQLKIPYKAHRRRIELHFADARPLSSADHRPASAKIEFLGFV